MELVELKSPKGITVRVSPAKAERLVKNGYRRTDEPEPAPKRRGRPPKNTQSESES